MTTGRDLITLALKDAGIVGVGQTANAEDVNDGLTRLNAMIAQWSRRRWLVYHLVDVVFQATGALSYSIGVGGDINTSRPDQIESGYFRQNVGVPGNQVDYPLVQIPAKETYNLISLKAMQSFPQYFFYDSGWPLGNVFIWPVPTSLYEIHLSLKATLQQVANLSDDIDFPPEYEEAIRLNLSVRLRVSYQLPPDPGLNTLAKLALNTLKNSNAQIPTLQLPQGLLRGNRPYNLYSDSQG